jgi:hypothetical protein
MLIAIVALAGLLSFGSSNVMHRTSTSLDPVQQERVISHTIGSVELVKEDVPQPPSTPPSPVPVTR